MSNQSFAFFLCAEGIVLCVWMILYFFIKRREPLAFLSAAINGLFGYFFWLLGGGNPDQQQAGLAIYRTALCILFVQAANILIITYYLVSRLFGKNINVNPSE